jgi:hypothetical protein
MRRDLSSGRETQGLMLVLWCRLSDSLETIDEEMPFINITLVAH